MEIPGSKQAHADFGRAAPATGRPMPEPIGEAIVVDRHMDQGPRTSYHSARSPQPSSGGEG